MFDYSRMHIRPEDYLHCLDEGKFMGYLYNPPEGPRQENELSATVYEKDMSTRYHVHDHGYETFCVDKGRVELTVCGKRCILDVGDLVHIEPHMPHGFKFLEEGTVWREMFHEMNMFRAHLDKFFLSSSNMALLDDPAFIGAFRAERGNFRLPDPEVELVDKTTLFQVSAKGTAKEQFTFDGLVCNLKFGRWQFNGIKELWEYVLDRDMALSVFSYVPYEGIYVVKEGRIRVEAAGQKFVAEPGDIALIPQYTPYKITALSEGTVLHDYNCRTMLLRMMEDLELLRSKGEMSPETVGTILQQHHCPVTHVGKAGV